MSTQVTPTEGLLVRAGMYQLLALGYAYPSAEQPERLQGLVAQLVPWVQGIHPDWVTRLDRLQSEMDTAHRPAIEADFNRLFSGGMDCVPHESAYEPQVFRKQHAMADIAGFYHAFGFDLPGHSRWPPDHLGVELEFCGILLQRMAHALQQGWAEQASICADALQKFLLDHPGRWVNAFTTDLEQAATMPGYRLLAAITREWIEGELNALGLAPDRVPARQVRPGEWETPVCSACAVCEPSPGQEAQ